MGKLYALFHKSSPEIIIPFYFLLVWPCVLFLSLNWVILFIKLLFKETTFVLIIQRSRSQVPSYFYTFYINWLQRNNMFMKQSTQMTLLLLYTQVELLEIQKVSCLPIGIFCIRFHYKLQIFYKILCDTVTSRTRRTVLILSILSLFLLKAVPTRNSKQKFHDLIYLT